MTDDLIPANANLSLSDVTRPTDRRFAEDMLHPVCDLLARADVPSPMVADILFDRLMVEAVPRGTVTPRAVVGYLAQLKRYQAVLQERIDKIEG